MNLFEASTLLEASPERVFAFHENPNNLRMITPSSLKILKLEAGTSAVVGEKFLIEIAQFGFPIRWRGVWETVSPPRVLVDVAERSPFSSWRHSHIFEAERGGCRMTDRVEYSVGWGFLGWIAERVVLPLFFAGMFRSRHAATRRFFAEATRG